MSGLDTHTHTQTHTQDDYRNPRCACAPRVNHSEGGKSVGNHRNPEISYAEKARVVPLALR